MGTEEGVMRVKTWDEAPDSLKRRAYAMGFRCPDCDTKVGIQPNGRKLNDGRSYQHAETPECGGYTWDAAEYLVTDAEIEAARG